MERRTVVRASAAEVVDFTPNVPPNCPTLVDAARGFQHPAANCHNLVEVADIIEAVDYALRLQQFLPDLLQQCLPDLM